MKWREVVGVSGLCMAMAFVAPRTLAQQPGQSVFAINDADPVSSVPSAADAKQRPLEMGYFVMELSDRAVAAEQRGDFKRAAQYYRAMAKAVPDRATGFSKACAAHAQAKEWDAALEVCRVALATEGVTLGDLPRFVHVMLQREQLPTPQEVEELDAVIAQMRKSAPNTAQAKLELASLECQVAARVEDEARLRSCTAALTKLAPKAPQTLAYTLTLALKQGDFLQAERVVQRAARAGVPHASLEQMRAQIAMRRPAPGATITQRLPTSLWLALSLGTLATCVGLLTIALRRRTQRA